MTTGLPSTSRLLVPRTYNFRVVAPEGVRPGVLYRSDSLHRLTKDGRRMLGELGVGLVIDLRSDLDRRLGGRDRLRGVDATSLRLPIAGTGRRSEVDALTLRSMYRTILDSFGAQVSAAIRAIADADRAVVVHCTAGKDRTGLVVALTLLALGIDRDTVVADYAQSGPNLEGEWAERMVRRVRRFRVRITPPLREVLTGSPAQALRDTLDWLDAERGGVDRYLASIGVDDEVRARLAASLAAPAPGR